MAAAAAAAENVSGWRGPLCDPLGFSQHVGECWSDSIQQMILFSDKFKDKTQYELYNKPDEYWIDRINKLFQFLKNADYSEYIKTTFGFDILRLHKAFKNFFLNFKERFKAHYDFIIHPEFPKNSSCPLLRPRLEEFPANTNIKRKYTLKRTISEKTSISSARGIEAEHNISHYGSIPESNINRSNTGLASKGSGFIINLVLWVFGIGYISQLITDASQIDTTTVVAALYHFSIPTLKKDEFGKLILNDKGKLISLNPRGHACSLYICDGKTIFYDNNRGPFAIDIPFEEAIKITGVFILADAYRLFKGDKVWRHGKWEEMMGEMGRISPEHTMIKMGISVIIPDTLEINYDTQTSENFSGGYYGKYKRKSRKFKRSQYINRSRKLK